jgi:hypothetical protein
LNNKQIALKGVVTKKKGIMGHKKNGQKVWVVCNNFPPTTCKS